MANRFWVGGTGTWDAADTTHWAATSGGAGGQSVPGVSDDVTFDGSSGGGTVTVDTDFNINSISSGAFTGTLDFSVNNNTVTLVSAAWGGAGTRTVSLGSSTWNITGNNLAVWSLGTATGLTITASTANINFTYAGSVGTRTWSSNIGGVGGSFPNFNVTAGTDIFSVAATADITGNFSLVGFSGTFTAGAAMNMRGGNLTLSGTATYTETSTRTLSFLATSGVNTITSNGATFGMNVTENGVGGTLRLLDALALAPTNTLTLTNGTFDANNQNVTCGLFSSSNSNTRVLTMGSGTWTLTGSGAAIWTTATTTGLTLNKDTSTVNCTYSGATGTRTITTGASAALGLNNLKISAGTDAVTLTSTCFCADLDWTGFTGQWNQSTASVSGNLTLGTGMTVQGVSTSNVNMTATSGTKTITSNGVVLKRRLSINGVGGSFQLADDLALDTTTNSQFELLNGVFNANNKNVTAPTVSASNANTRALTMGSGTWTLTGSATTVWSMGTVSNLTLNSGTSTIKITDTTDGAKNQMTIGGSTLTFNKIWWNRGTSTGTNFMSGSFIVSTLVDDGTVAHSLTRNSGSNLTVNNWKVSGNPGQLISIDTDGATTTHNLIKTGGGYVSSDYLVIQHSVATPANTWYAGVNSTDNQAVADAGSGWIFSSAPSTVGQGVSGSVSSLSNLSNLGLRGILKR